mmetsp:Transcript_8107/g.18133  ORF Transcript_8107/g.18133 Transcript_8107/m.18133 type:complete len:226 (-) Transcript_8107:1195-1872(-)
MAGRMISQVQNAQASNRSRRTFRLKMMGASTSSSMRSSLLLHLVMSSQNHQMMYEWRMYKLIAVVVIHLSGRKWTLSMLMPLPMQTMLLLNRRGRRPTILRPSLSSNHLYPLALTFPIGQLAARAGATARERAPVGSARHILFRLHLLIGVVRGMVLIMILPFQHRHRHLQAGEAREDVCRKPCSKQIHPMTTLRLHCDFPWRRRRRQGAGRRGMAQSVLHHRLG